MILKLSLSLHTNQNSENYIKLLTLQSPSTLVCSSETAERPVSLSRSQSNTEMKQKTDYLNYAYNDSQIFILQQVYIENIELK